MNKETRLTDSEIFMIGQKTRALEAGESGYILPVAFARAIEQAVLQSQEIQALRKDAERFNEAFDLLKTLFESWENGPACYEDGNIDDYIGQAFRLDDKTFHACVAMLNGRNQADAAMEQEND